jgi:hypothetical protein
MLARPKKPRAEFHCKVYISAGGVSIEALLIMGLLKLYRIHIGESIVAPTVPGK